MRLLICTQAVDMRDHDLGFFHRWIEEFAKHCESVTVICLREGTHQLPANVRVLSLGKEKKPSRLRYVLRFYCFIIRYARQYDAVFIHMNPEYAVMGGLIWKMFGKRRMLWYAHKSVTLKLRIGSRMVNVICTPSAESFRLKRKNVVVTGHGIDTAMFGIPRGKPADFLRIISVSRISRSKNIGVMLETAAELPKNGVPYRLTIVGAPVTRDDEKYADALLDRVGELHLASFVGFAGAKEHAEIPALLVNSDVFFHASATGSLDKAMLEALCAGCIVVSCNDAAKPILAMVQDGLSVRSADAGSFAQAIKKIYELGSEARAAAGERGRALVEEKHSLHALIPRLIELCKSK